MLRVGEHEWRRVGQGTMVAVAVAVFVAFGAALSGQSPPRPADEIPFERLKADAVVPVGLLPGAVATSDALLIPAERGIVRVNNADNAVAPTALVGQRPCAGLATLGGRLWAPLCDHRRIARVDEKTFGVATPVELAIADPAGRIAAGLGSLWVASSARGIVSRVDADSGGVVAEIRVAPEPSTVVFADDAVWITSAVGDVLTHVNAHTNEVVDTVKVGPRPGRLVVGEGAVWTLNRGDGSISRVDPKTHKVEQTIAIGAPIADGDIAVGEGGVWLSAKGAPIVRIDLATHRVAQRFTGAGGGAVAVAHGSVWVSVDANTTWRLDPRLMATLRP